MNDISKPNVYVSERLRNPEEGGGKARSENFGWAAALAIVSTLLFIALLFLQAMEYGAIKAA